VRRARNTGGGADLLVVWAALAVGFPGADRGGGALDLRLAPDLVADVGAGSDDRVESIFLTMHRRS